MEEDVVARVRGVLTGFGAIREVKMFGGIGFMLNGNMIAAVSKRGLLLRVGKERYKEALSHPGASPMEIRSRPMQGYVYVDPASLHQEALRDWLQLAHSFVRTMPPKSPS